MKKRKNIVIIITAAVICLVAVFMVYYRGEESSAYNSVDPSSVSDALKGEYKSGTYSATENGRGGNITVNVTFSEDTIIEIEIESENETRGIGSNAITEMAQRVLNEQSSDVDAVSGATITSDAVKLAVKNCIEQASVK